MDSQWRSSSKRSDLDPATCSTEIQTAVKELQALFGQEGLRAIEWNEHFVGVAFTIQVDIPTRGTVGGVDIREQEPILLLLHKVYYPNKAPLVFSDRPTFPVQRLAHLNPALVGQMAWLCLHRGSIDDWFAEHSLTSLVERVKSWLRDAASNRLIRKGDRFEPTRTEIERRAGIAIYDPAMLEDFIKAKWTAGVGRGLAGLPCWLLTSASRHSSIAKTPFPIRIGRPISIEAAREFRESVKRIDGLGDTQSGTKDRGLLGLLIWPDQDRICDEYFGQLPDSLAGLVEFADGLGLPAREALDQYRVHELQLLGEVPLILAIRRPQPLIGSESSMEFINLVLSAGGEYQPARDGWKPGTPVLLLGNRAPVTVKLARDLSNVPLETPNARFLLIGCGAIGSKTGLHLARAGLASLTLLDHDDLSPHNLVRHGLLADSVGENKAVELGKTINAIYSDDPENVQVRALPCTAVDVLFGHQRELLVEHDWILDCTASASVLNALTDIRLAQSPPVMRIEIADRGRLGFVIIEGENRNPRLDDLRIALYDRAVEDNRISAWLQRQRSDAEDTVGPALEEITIGLGCSSATMRMADDVVSYHAAAAAMTLRARAIEETQLAGVQISFLSEDATSIGAVEFVKIGKSRELIPRRASGWRVRLGEMPYTQIQHQMCAAGPNETGGVLLGFIHHKRKVIYVTRALAPPSDSQGWPYAFRMGVKDVPRQLVEIEERTGGLIGYVGEWHSHPNGHNRLSHQDKKAVRQISAHLKAVGLPVHIMVVTSKGCYPFIFHHR